MQIKELTKEQYTLLSDPQYQWFLKTAYYSQYITGLTYAQTLVLYDIYNDLFRPKKTKTGCSQCKLEVCQQLGRLYYNYKGEKKPEKKPRKTALEKYQEHKAKEASKPKKTNKKGN